MFGKIGPLAAVYRMAESYEFSRENAPQAFLALVGGAFVWVGIELVGWGLTDGTTRMVVIGVATFILGIPLFVAAYFWTNLKPHIAPTTTLAIEQTALNWHVWLFLFVTMMTFSVLSTIFPEARTPAKIAQVENDVATINKYLALYVLPRRVTNEQYNAVLKYLADKPHQSLIVASVEDDRESVQYATDIEQMFQAAKWTVTDSRISLEQLKTQVGMNQVEGIALGGQGSCDQGPQLMNGAFEQMKVLIVGTRIGGSSKPEPCKMTLYVGRRLRVYLPRTREMEVPEE